MTTLYRPVLIESAEQAEALPEGTVVIGTAAGVVEKGGRGRWWAGLHQVDARAVVGGAALLPIEAEEEKLWEGDQHLRTQTRYVTPWTPKE